ncbi:MAG: tetratricopeptide repeat protein [bacterium]
MAARRLPGRAPGVLLGLVVLGLAASPARADVGALMRRGNGLFARGRFDEALAAYQQAEVREPDATAIRFNAGNALHRLGRYDEALRELELVMTDRNQRRRADALYNIGNTLFRAGRLGPAINSYKAALLLNPDDRQAKQNLEYCLKKQEEQQNQEQPPDSSGQDQQQQQPQPRPEPEMSQEEAERMMQALDNKERREQEKAQAPTRQKQVEKDW